MDRLDRNNKTSVESLGRFEYDTKERLGFGAFAIVFKGWLKEKPSIEVAVKVIAKKNIQKSQNLLEKEIKILSELTKLQHENVVALLECVDQPTNVFLVMEYCNGGDLQDYLNVQKSLSENTIRLFTRQLAGAMRALNAKGIVHRDLKPQNILLKFDPKFTARDKKGSRMYPRPEEIMLKIADFGFARFLTDGVMAATMCGSPMYMAPEVIMSQKYDAKADLWSLGTIIYQCLLSYAPFNATTPAGLKNIYEKRENLVPSFPESISPDLRDLLTRLLKRNSSERISFEDFFNHPFLKKTSSPMRPKPLPSPPRELKKNYIEVQDKKKPSALPEPTKCNQLEIFNNKFSYNTVISSETSDDFVLVPANLPTDKQCREMNSSPPRPSTLPIQIPKNSSSPKKTVERETSPVTVERWNSVTTNVNSISPPPVQFVLGTPPLNRRPPDSPTGVCMCSGGSNNNNRNWAVTPTGSPLRRSVVSSPLLSSPFALMNSNSFAPKTAFNARAITLPEIKNIGTAMGLIYPELNEGRLFQKEHTEILTKLNFVMVLIECILECANPSRERSERLVLLVRALQLLSCGLTLATNELKSGRLQPSKNVKNVVKQLNEKFHKCLEDCKRLNTPSVLEKVSATAEKILYNYAIEMCQKAALNELQNNLAECFKRYQVAQIILHSLAQQINHKQDKAMLSKYQAAVEKRLSLLQDKQQFIFENNCYILEDEKNSNDAF
ncbi:serine/threonine-protein kinase ULK2-like isoform X2 [Planococcus citri]|uniref:serine/threonine-protein kinase ULK2-like isoform X2 n=1 Tax=Planococcus citri TaxID=170843 RepID=UPI0031F8F01C